MPRLLLPLALLFVLPACMSDLSRQSRLAKNLNRYADDVRWARWNDAAQMMVPSLRAPFLAAGRRRGPDFRVADLEMGGLAMDEEEERAVVQVQIEWYTMRQTFMRSTLVELEWRYLEGEWMMVGEKHAGGEPLM